MKMFSKTLAVTVAFAMTMVIISCGNPTKPSVSTEVNNLPVAVTWKIGSTTTDTTGSEQDVQQGAQIAVDEINIAGGINGYMIELYFVDDASMLEEMGVQLVLTVKDSEVDTIDESFATKYQAMYGKSPTPLAADAYNSVYMIKTAIEEANATPSSFTSDMLD